MFCLSHSSYSPGVSQKDYSIEKSHKRSSYSLKLFLCLSFLSITQTCFTFSETITVYVGESHKLFTSIVVCLSVQLLIQTFLCLVYHPNIFTQTPFWVYHTNCSCKCFYWCSITQTKYIPTTEPLFVFWYLIQAIYPNCFYCWSMTQVIHPIVLYVVYRPNNSLKLFYSTHLFNFWSITQTIHPDAYASIVGSSSKLFIQTYDSFCSITYSIHRSFSIHSDLSHKLFIQTVVILIHHQI